MEKRFLTVAEISQYLGFKPSAIRCWVRKGTIPFNKLNGGIRFDIEKIERWISHQARQSEISANN